MQLLSVNVGRPRLVEWRGRSVRTAIWKEPVAGRRRARRLNIDGDNQADLVGHGGEERAVLVYQLGSYEHWARELGRDDLAFGRFGENLTVEGLGDDEVCVGDRYRIGSALFEVTQPRVTCFKVGIRLDEPRMPALLVGQGRPGFYMRVLEEGELGAGDEIAKVAGGPGGLTVREVSAMLYQPDHDPGRLERVLAVKALSPGWRASFEAMLAQARAGVVGGNAGLTPAAGPPPSWSGFRDFRVAEVTRETIAVRSLLLEPADGAPLGPWSPGQYVAMRLAPAGRPAFTRSYSISSAPHPDRLRLSVKREPGGRASGYIHDELGVGETVAVGAPRGAFVLPSVERRPVALISAGIGATPMLAMLEWLVEAGDRRPVWWLHGARRGDEHAFAVQTRVLLAALPAACAQILYSRPAQDDVRGVHYDAPGRLDVSTVRGAGVPREADFFICGPAAMMEAVARGLDGWGVDPARVHTEAFGAEIPSGAPPPHPLPGEPGIGPTVRFGRSGLAVAWDEGYATLLELAEACDVPVQWSCRTGVCHRCETGLLAGSVTYGPAPLDPPAEGNALLCCSRPAGEVDLDL